MSEKNSIVEFYKLHHDKGKLYTYSHWKNSSVSRKTIYRIMSRFDEDGTIERKKGSGRPSNISKADERKIKKMLNNKTGMSQRKIANNLGVGVATVNRNIKKQGIKYRKRKRVPKATEGQKERQIERLKILCAGKFSFEDNRDIIMDDESYLTFSGAGMPGNTGFYTDDIKKCPEKVKFRGDEKFPPKVMIHATIGKKGISRIYVAPHRTSMDGALYRKEALKRLVQFIDEHYESRDQVIFWPDLATCHYTKENLKFLTDHGIAYVEKHENPPSAPHIRPIENYWGILKMKVYDKNWSAKTRPQMIRRIKQKVKEIDQNMVARMFDNLKAKIHSANENGLSSLL